MSSDEAQLPRPPTSPETTRHVHAPPPAPHLHPVIPSAPDLTALQIDAEGAKEPHQTPRNAPPPAFGVLFSPPPSLSAAAHLVPTSTFPFSAVPAGSPLTTTTHLFKTPTSQGRDRGNTMPPFDPVRLLSSPHAAAASLLGGGGSRAPPPASPLPQLWGGVQAGQMFYPQMPSPSVFFPPMFVGGVAVGGLAGGSGMMGGGGGGGSGGVEKSSPNRPPLSLPTPATREGAEHGGVGEVGGGGIVPPPFPPPPPIEGLAFPPVQPRPSTRASRPSSSGYIGVSQYKRSKRYEAHIWLSAAKPGGGPAKRSRGGGVLGDGGAKKGKQLHIGSFSSSAVAAGSYDRAAIFIRGNEAELNFPRSSYNDDEILRQLSTMKHTSIDSFILKLRSMVKDAFEADVEGEGGGGGGGGGDAGAEEGERRVIPAVEKGKMGPLVHSAAGSALLAAAHAALFPPGETSQEEEERRAMEAMLEEEKSGVGRSIANSRPRRAAASAAPRASEMLAAPMGLQDTHPRYRTTLAGGNHHGVERKGEGEKKEEVDVENEVVAKKAKRSAQTTTKAPPSSSTPKGRTHPPPPPPFSSSTPGVTPGPAAMATPVPTPRTVEKWFDFNALLSPFPQELDPRLLVPASQGEVGAGGGEGGGRGIHDAAAAATAAAAAATAAAASAAAAAARASRVAHHPLTVLSAAQHPMSPAVPRLAVTMPMATQSAQRDLTPSFWMNSVGDDWSTMVENVRRMGGGVGAGGGGVVGGRGKEEGGGGGGGGKEEKGPVNEEAGRDELAPEGEARMHRS